MKPILKLFWNCSLYLGLLQCESVYARAYTIGLVDGYSSWSLAPGIARELSPESEITWILIQTHPYSEDQERFVSTFPNSIRIKMAPMEGGMTVQEVADYLRARNIDAVWGGMDEGSSRSPALNEILGMRDNPARSVDLRRDKDKLDIAAGEWAIPKIGLGQGIDEYDWLKAQGANEFVLKFTHGVNGTGMRFGQLGTRENFERWLENLGPRKSYILNRNDKSLIMPRIRGRKFFANTYTFEGKTVLTAVSEYFMIELDDQVYYFLDGYLDLDSDEALAMKKIIDQTYPKFEIVHGMAHPEFVQDETTGEFYYIEMNARVVGVGAPAVERKVYGYSHLDLHLLSLLDPDRLRALMAKGLRRENSAFIAIPTLSSKAKYNRAKVGKFLRASSAMPVEEQYKLPFNTDLIPTPDQAPVAGAFYFAGDKESVRASVSSFYQHLQDGAFFDSDCSSSFLRPGFESELKKGMAEAFSKIQWSKF